jgi:transcriptional regulator with PAS, ATPase and Fis domain
MDSQDLQRIKNRYDIIGNDPVLNRALETAMAVAPTDLTVLISGESGVGKEMIPRIIHQNSLRRNGKYFAVNCGGIPEGTINSELFGHEKGSFTGATETRKGYFEEANGGTLFLDEVGELPMSTQVMLLRVLQNGEYIKVGSSKVEKTDVRVVAATNVNLMYAVAQGKFREDLYYRLNAIQIRMPALRDRKDDIYLLFRKFTSDFSEKYRVCKIALTHDGIIALRNYRWPGNIRQLKNVAETVSALESVKLTPGAERLEIDAETLRKYLPKEEENVLPAIAGSQGSAFSEDEKKMLVKAILDLRQEVDQLKMAVYSGHQPAHRLPAVPVREEPEAQEPEPYEEADWQEPETQEQSPAPAPDLSLQKVSEDLIQKALEKHNGNRKLAAAELGISERTLYRRLSKEMKK